MSRRRFHLNHFQKLTIVWEYLFNSLVTFVTMKMPQENIGIQVCLVNV